MATLIAGPPGANLNGATGALTWAVPVGAQGWEQFLVHVTHANGSTDVNRYWALSDAAAPLIAAVPPAVAVVDYQSISVTAPTSVDAAGVLSYRLERNGIVVSDWQQSPDFLDSGLSPNTAYIYRVQVKDGSPQANVSAWSLTAQAVTAAAPPEDISLGTATAGSVTILAILEVGNPTTTEFAVYDATRDRYVTADGGAGPDPVWRTAAA